MKSALTLLLALWMTTVALAQSAKPREVAGVVTDPSGALVSAATITLLAPDNTEIEHTVSNDAGNFTLPISHPGKLRLRVHHAGGACQGARSEA